MPDVMSESSEASTARRQTAPNSQPSRTTLDLATAALAKLKAARLPDEDGSQKQKIVNESPKKSVKPKGKERVATSSSSSSNNRAARRQEERRRQRAQRERLEEDQDDEKRDEDIMPQSLDSFGFLPHDYPLSDTDTETVNPVKERKKRVLRSRKRQLKAHLSKAIDENEFPDWDSIMAQARILQVKWVDDDLADFQQKAEREGTSWLKQLPHPSWLSKSLKTLSDIMKEYASVDGEGGWLGPCGEQLKARTLADIIKRELMEEVVDGLEAMSPDDVDDDSGVDWFKGALGYERVEGPQDVPCIGVKLPKSMVQTWDTL